MKKFVDVACPQCGHQIIDVFCIIPDYPACPQCAATGTHVQTIRLLLPTTVPTVIGDDIPGGVDIRHGLCHPDGTPKRFYSHTEIRKAAQEAGLTSRPERGIADKRDWDRLSKKVH